MRIAVDFQSAKGKKTGIGVFATNLFEALKSEETGIEFMFYDAGRQDLNTPRRVWWESVTVPLWAKRDRADLIYSPGFAPAMASGARRVVTVHDIIGMSHPSNQRGVSKFYWSRWLPAALKRAHRLVASSESTRRDLKRFLNIDESQVRIVPLSANSCFRIQSSKDTMYRVLKSRGLDQEPFYLAVGSLEPRKNLIRLLEAYASLLQSGDPGFCLALAGKPAGAENDLYRFVKEKNLENKIKFMGYVGDEELVTLYNASLGYVTVSLYEGFGLPALEAMCCGKSGVVSNRSSLPEVTGDTAILVDPDNPSQIADALKTYAADSALRHHLGIAAHARSASFTPTVTARAMIEVFEEAAS
jgi:glycosyltransferase involved in cell wall biosynthesis